MTQGETPLTNTPPEISDATPAEPEEWTEADELPVAEVRGLFTVVGPAWAMTWR